MSLVIKEGIIKRSYRAVENRSKIFDLVENKSNGIEFNYFYIDKAVHLVYRLIKRVNREYGRLRPI